MSWVIECMLSSTWFIKVRMTIYLQNHNSVAVTSVIDKKEKGIKRNPEFWMCGLTTVKVIKDSFSTNVLIVWCWKYFGSALQW